LYCDGHVPHISGNDYRAAANHASVNAVSQWRSGRTSRERDFGDDLRGKLWSFGNKGVDLRAVSAGKRVLITGHNERSDRE
jgi:hypothetical protein